MYEHFIGLPRFRHRWSVSITSDSVKDNFDPFMLAIVSAENLIYQKDIAAQ